MGLSLLVQQPTIICAELDFSIPSLFHLMVGMTNFSIPSMFHFMLGMPIIVSDWADNFPINDGGTKKQELLHKIDNLVVNTNALSKKKGEMRVLLQNSDF